MAQESVEEMREWMRNYINHTCVYRARNKSELIPGKIKDTQYIWQFYLRRALANDQFCKYVGITFWEMCGADFKKRQFQIAGLEWASTPLLCAIGTQAKKFGINCNTLSIRANRKPYGFKNRFEGIIDYNLPVLVIDDLCNSKNTLIRARQYCLDEGLEIYDYGFAIINKDVDGSHVDHDKYIGDDFKFKTVFNLQDLDMRWEEYFPIHGENQLVPFVPERALSPSKAG